MQVKAGSLSFITEMDKIMKILVYFCNRELDYGNGLEEKFCAGRLKERGDMALASSKEQIVENSRLRKGSSIEVGMKWLKSQRS